ncbi:MAG: hypothetical protein ACR2IM_02635, partial [Sediminibacterium sp.]
MLKNKNIFLLSMAILFSVASIAQSNTMTPPPQTTNYLEVLMVSVALLLVVVVWILARVLMMISKKAVEISKSGIQKQLIIFVISLGSLFSRNLYAQDATISDTTSIATSTNYYGGVSFNTFWTMTTVILLELLIVFLLVIFIKNIFKSIHPVENK